MNLDQCSEKSFCEELCRLTRPSLRQLVLQLMNQHRFAILTAYSAGKAGISLDLSPEIERLIAGFEVPGPGHTKQMEAVRDSFKSLAEALPRLLHIGVASNKLNLYFDI